MGRKKREVLKKQAKAVAVVAIVIVFAVTSAHTIDRWQAGKRESISPVEPDSLSLREGKVPIRGEPRIDTYRQMQAWAESRGAHRRFVDIATLYWEYGKKTGLRPEVLYAQSAKETAFGHYTGVVSPEQNNWAGIKTADASGDRPEDHESFDTPEEGVRAHFNHMKAYVGMEPSGETHERYYVVMSLSWAGEVECVKMLGGKWAPAPDYGESIVNNYLADLLATPPPYNLESSTEN